MSPELIAALYVAVGVAISLREMTAFRRLAWTFGWLPILVVMVLRKLPAPRGRVPKPPTEVERRLR